MKVVINVGHGGGDCGAVNQSSGHTEHQYNLSLSSALKSHLSKDGFEVDIVIQNKLNGLPTKINALNPDFIISLHSNAFNTKAKGSECLYHPSSKKGLLLAESIQREIVKLGRVDRGVKPRDNLLILRKTNAPCVIIEPFFIDNDDEHQWAISNVDALAKAVSIGARKYAGDL